MEFTIHLATLCSAYLLAASALRFITIRAGLFLAAAAVPFSIGAYSVALMSRIDMVGGLAGLVISPLLSIPAAAIVCTMATRMSPAMLLAATLLMQGVFFLVIYNWGDQAHPIGSLQNLTNGPQGLAVADGLSAQIADPLIALLTILSGIAGWRWFHRLENGLVGLGLDAIRGDADMARALGLNVIGLRSSAIVMAYLFVAVAGGLVALDIKYVDPSTGSIQMGLTLLSLGLLAAAGKTAGPVIATGLLIALPEMLRLIEVSTAAANYLRLGLCATAVLFVLLLQRHTPLARAVTTPL